MKGEVYWTTKRYIAIQHLVGESAEDLAQEFSTSEESVRKWAEKFDGAGREGITPEAIARIKNFLHGCRRGTATRGPDLERDLKTYLTQGATAMRQAGERPATPVTPLIEVLAGNSRDDVARKYDIDSDLLLSWLESFEKAGREALGENREEKTRAVLSLLKGDDKIVLSEDLPGKGASPLSWRGPYAGKEEERLAIELLEWREVFLEAGGESVTNPCGHLFILSGAPTAGKTMLINMLIREKDLRPAAVPKYTSRAWRGPDDDSEQHDEINDQDFEFTYPYNENRYGLQAGDIRDILSQGFNAFVAVSPPRIVRSIKKLLGPLAVSLYLHSDRAERNLEETVRERRPHESADELERKVRAKTINLRLRHRQYVDNIALYDHVLLNTSSRRVLLKQAKSVIRLYDRMDAPSAMPGFGANVLFLLCAPPGSGKATISRILEDFGGKLIENLHKEVDRVKRENDGKEIVPLGELDDGREKRGIIKEVRRDLTYISNGSRYGIQCDEIWEKFSEGKVQLVITNMKAIARFRRRFGPIVVPVYVYTPKSEQELLEYFTEEKKLCRRLAAERVKQVERVFLEFVDKIAMFRHVILNTATRDDIADQMLNLLEHYEVRRNVIYL
ncbi:MAG: hypothetical protein GY719_09085 [bacterium]|nr:hypothetical protein [bacterium]